MKRSFVSGILTAGLVMAAVNVQAVPPGGRMGAGGAMHADAARMQEMQHMAQKGMQTANPHERMQMMQKHMQMMQEMMKHMHAMPMGQMDGKGKMSPDQMQQRQAMMEKRMQMMQDMMQQMLNQQQMMMKQQQESMKK